MKNLQKGWNGYSSFLKEIRFHPNNKKISLCLERIFKTKNLDIDGSMIDRLLELTNNDYTIIRNVLIMKAMVLREEGLYDLFLLSLIQALDYTADEDYETILNLEELLDRDRSPLKTYYFYRKIKEKLSSKRFPQERYQEVVQRLESLLERPLGYINQQEDDITDSEIIPRVTPEIEKLHKEALNFLEKGFDAKNPVYIQTFFHRVYYILRLMFNEPKGEMKRVIRRKLDNTNLETFIRPLMDFLKIYKKILENNYVPTSIETIKVKELILSFIDKINNG